MCKGNPSIPSILQNLWDTDLKDSNVMIILCGSAMSFIEKELSCRKNPLYGRATGIYKMNETGILRCCPLSLPNYSAQNKILAYAVLGGIPHYLNQFETLTLTLMKTSNANILTKGSVLYSEVRIFLSPSGA